MTTLVPVTSSMTGARNHPAVYMLLSVMGGCNLLLAVLRAICVPDLSCCLGLRLQCSYG
jgi:Zn-dependent protease